MTAWPSVDDLPACPNCNSRTWQTAHPRYYNCGNCTYKTRQQTAHEGTLDWPSQPIGKEHVDRALLDVNVNLDEGA